MRFLLTLACGLALGAAACGELDNVTTVKDLRVLGVKCEPAGFLVDLTTPGAGTDADWRAVVTALVVDPNGQGQELQVSAVGCPDYIDTITSATLQGTKLCPPESATSQIPEPIGPLLMTTTIVSPDMPLSFPPVNPTSVRYEPRVSFGLRTDQLKAFFSRGFGIPAIDKSIAYNREFGIPAIVNLTFDLNGEHTVAIKNVVYWPLLKEVPDPVLLPQVANHNPTLGNPANPGAPRLHLYSHRDETTGKPDQEITDNPPKISISAMDKLYVDPVYDNAAENYWLRVNNVDTGMIETRMERELIRFYFYATAGTFDDPLTLSEPNPITGAFFTDSQYKPPKPEMVPAEGLQVTIFIVAHDERAGTDWTSTTITVVP